MNSNILEYKGYHTKVEFNADDLTLRGKIEGISDLVDFECEDIRDVKKEFESAVDEYLEFCKEVGKEPDKEYKGSFNVRIDPKLHRKLANIAFYNDVSLNTAVEEAIKEYVDGDAYFKGIRQYATLSQYQSEELYKYDGREVELKSSIIPFNFHQKQVKEV